MFKQQFPDTVVAGNMRISALEQLPKIGPETPVVLELSSWQLEGLGEAKLSPQYACYLNLSPDHLDRYGSMEAYAEAKEQIFLYQSPSDVAVFNSRLADYSHVYTGPERGWQFWKTPARKIWFMNADAPVADEIDDELNPGQHFDERDAFIGWENDRLVWQPSASTTQGPYREEVICMKADVQLVGHHNLANIAAAAALAKTYGVENENIKRAIQNFTGVPDRMEQVRVVDGVRYINDTTATAPAAAIAALNSVDAPTVVIAGGADKRLAFDEFAQVLVQRAKAIVLLNGTATPKLQAALDTMIKDAASVPSVAGPFDAFKTAVAAARELAVSGDIVLLSPGCASFGMFKNEFDRGEQFREIVQALPS
jgi:UDP-N-acetylmuramoylalanine--D-glutamate ligase